MSSLARAFLALVVAALAAPAPVRASDRKAEILAVEAQWNDAIVSRDADRLDAILADEFRLTWADGSVTGKAELIAAVRTRKAELEPIRTEQVDVRVYGRTAVVTGRFLQSLSLGEARASTNVRYTDVYIRRGGRWQAVSAHASIIR